VHEHEHARYCPRNSHVPNSVGCTHNAHVHARIAHMRTNVHIRALAHGHMCCVVRTCLLTLLHPLAPARKLFLSSFSLSLSLVLSRSSLTRTRHQKDDAENRAPVPGEAPAGHMPNAEPRQESASHARLGERACSPTERLPNEPSDCWVRPRWLLIFLHSGSIKFVFFKKKERKGSTVCTALQPFDFFETAGGIFLSGLLGGLRSPDV